MKAKAEALCEKIAIFVKIYSESKLYLKLEQRHTSMRQFTAFIYSDETRHGDQNSGSPGHFDEIFHKHEMII